MNPELSITQSEPPEFYTAADVGAEVGKSATAIKQLTLEMRLPILRTRSGIWIFTRPMVEKIAAEVSRRRVEADHR
jgi:hypothetical protein